ncbi:DUF1403 family protein [Pseudogemmobacter humi]|uniref:Uncharacterized protein n=1 Tax=Pseudogemmobacter humi TaxID=2483812 RepID=A0A3P5XF83_9RHOB|nr:DUF1403 family protein [Pseudogemmobacter humi]VDC33420.1 hypothetical protein XINFAN_03820 [Pseudogemmobacter humi]
MIPVLRGISCGDGCAVARPISVSNLGRALEGVAPERIALTLDATGPTPVDRATQVMEAVLTGSPRGEVTALILADAVLSLALGRDQLLPLLGPVMTARDLRLACLRSAVRGGPGAAPGGHTGTAAARLRAAVPKLRAKGAARAAEMILPRDVLTPMALARAMPDSLSDGAARRLCERLVELGVLWKPDRARHLPPLRGLSMARRDGGRA